MKKKLALLVIILNCVAALLFLAVLNGAVSLGEKVRGKAAEKGEIASESFNKEDAKILRDKDLLKNKEKFESSLEVLKKKYKRAMSSNPELYLKIPESEFFKSFIAFFFLSRMIGNKEVILDDEMVKDFKDKGLLIYSMDKKYPLMKKSIYIDRGRKTYNKPVIAPGTNVIVIFVESFSSLFLREDIHGVKGLLPNIRDMQSRSYYFTKMNNMAFPTIKGLIASLGSCIYLLDESVGGTRIPIPCRFLFLSTVLKKLDYNNAHIQAGSERFISMKDFFMKRENYDEFYGSESLAIDNISSMKGGFGVDDETLFNYMVRWLDRYPGKKPFLLTISTINTHPPFKVRYQAPGVGDSILLNSFYSTDRAFGIFWEYFKKSKYFKNTVLIVTADHAMGNSKEYNEFAGKFGEYYRPFFDTIPCFMYFPGTAAWRGKVNDTACTNLDILPTVLDMMNLDLPNPFMGVSIFSERPFYNSFMLAAPAKKMPMEKAVEQGKKYIEFIINLYKTDRIIPKDYQVRFN